MPFSIILADDSEAYLAGMRRAFERHEAFDLLASCVDGAEARDAIARLQPDLAVLDVSMPELTGPEVVEHVRDQAERTVFVLLSAQANVEELADDCQAALGITKDLSRAVLLERFLALMEGSAGES